MSTEVSTTVPKRVRVQAPAIYRPEDAESLLQVLAAAAMDPRCDVAKMQAIRAMQKEIQAEEARLTFVQEKLELTKKLPIINKDGKIEFKDKGQGAPKPLRFASFENINDVIKPLLQEHNFDLWFSSEPGVPGMVNVIGHLEHSMGYARTSTFPLPRDESGGKSGAQGWASAFSFGKRITTIGLLNLQTRAIEDLDRDGNPANFKRAKQGYAEVPDKVATVSPAQVHELALVMEDARVSEVNFCTKYGIAKVADLPAELFDAAVKALNDHKAKAKG